MNAPDLSVRIGSLTLKNPIMAASGCFGYGVEYADLVDLSTLGAVVSKGLFLAEREGHPAPRIVETPAGMLNAIGLQGIGVHRFVAEKLPELRRLNAEKIASFAGQTAPETLWRGVVFHPFTNNAVESAFADRRTYTYQGREIDRQVHLGFDLASVAQAPVVAAGDGMIEIEECAMAGSDDAALVRWTGAANAPTAVWNGEPARTDRNGILFLAERLAPEPRVARAVHFAHAACAERGDDVVVAETGTRDQRHRLDSTSPEVVAGFQPCLGQPLKKMPGKFGIEPLVHQRAARRAEVRLLGEHFRRSRPSRRARSCDERFQRLDDRGRLPRHAEIVRVAAIGRGLVVITEQRCAGEQVNVGHAGGPEIREGGAQSQATCRVCVLYCGLDPRIAECAIFHEQDRGRRPRRAELTHERRRSLGDLRRRHVRQAIDDEHRGIELGDEPADVLYKVDRPYNRETEGGILWSDLELDIKWPVERPTVSDRDRQLQTFAQYKANPPRW